MANRIMRRCITILCMLLGSALLTACGTSTATMTNHGATARVAEASDNHTHSASSEAADDHRPPDSSTVTDHSHGEEFELPHVHGLGFAGDGKQLLIPAHIGLFRVRDRTWQGPSGPAHDYMGFAMSDDAFSAVVILP